MNVSKKGNIDFTKGSIIRNLILFSVPITKAFGLTISTFVSQNVGARNYERSREGILRCLALSLAVTFVLGAVVYVFTDRCVSLFSTEPDVVETGSTMLKFLIPFYLVMVVREIFLGTLRGYGYARTPMIISLFGMVVLRQLFLAIVMRHPRIEYIYAAFPLGWGPPAAETGKELPLRDQRH